MLLAFTALVAGIAALVWSADRLVDGASGLAARLGVPSLLIGMVIVGFGTSLPELTVSAIASSNGNPGISLGNAYGSNVANIGLILGISALMSPVKVARGVLLRELPILVGVSLLAYWLLGDDAVSRLDAWVFLAFFFAWLALDIPRAMHMRADGAEPEAPSDAKPPMSAAKASMWLAVGLVGLVASSRALVWGAVEIARFFKVSDLVIGLTVVAVGTSLPELASSIVAARRGEHDIALGNVIGSNIFNTLAVVGLAGAIHPISAEPVVHSRDMPVMLAMTLSLFFFGYGRGKGGEGSIGRIPALLLLAAYVAYNVAIARGAAA